MSDSSPDLDVAIIGAGISGINTAYYLQTEGPPGTSYAILESRSNIGGTWDLFRYPGIRSDSDIYTFGFMWSPWSREAPLAPGGDIITYMRRSAEAHGIDKRFLFNYKVITANWNSKKSLWELSVMVGKKEGSDHPESNGGPAIKTIRSRFIVMGTGYYSYEKPLETVIPGLENFGGTIIHPQFWPEDFDYTNRNMVIIGSGATAVTVLPSVADRVKQVTMLQRSPSYIYPMPMRDIVSRIIQAVFPAKVASGINRLRFMLTGYFQIFLCHFFPRFARRYFRDITIKQLPPNVSWDPHFNPRYNPWEQRVCASPDGDFYAAIRAGKASVVTDTIKNITKDEIQLVSGKVLKPDTIVTATGLNMQFAGGIKITVDDVPFDVTQKYTWKGFMIQDLPNFVFVVGYVNASWTLGASVAAHLLSRVLRRMNKQGAVAAVPHLEHPERMKQRPLFDLSSNYLKKAAETFPRAGYGQWSSNRNYLADSWKASWGDISSGLLLK